jgi:SAM-dependent methyltransferase
LSLSPRELREVYRRQDGWFAVERGRLLRKVDLPARRRVLDLGCGSCETLAELDRRAAGFAVGADLDVRVLALGGGRRVAADARALPFPDSCFDLIFTQMFFMWARPAEVLPEIVRVLAPGGQLVACAEPDYGAAVEHPEAGGLDELTRGLEGEGADLRVGRRLGGELARAGLEVRSGLHPTDPVRAARPDGEFAAPELLAPRAELQFLFVPYFWFLARRR